MQCCAFCGCDPYEYVDIGVGVERVAVTCCALGCAVYDHRNHDDAEIPVALKELRDMAAKVSALQWQIERRDRLIDRETLTNSLTE